MTYKPTIAVDFDGVVHAYSQGWQGGEIYDGPISGAIQALKTLSDRGYNLVISTAREDTEAVEEKLKEWIGHDLCFEVTNRKPIAIAYIDDRAVHFTNWNDILERFPKIAQGGSK